MIGILHPGELGVALARPWVARGLVVRVMTAGRSDRTRAAARDAGLVECADLEHLVAECDTLVSVVTPGAALEVAGAVAACRSRRARVYVDACSAGPATKLDIDALLSARGIALVDAALQGRAADLASRAVLYLSGDRAAATAPLFEGVVATRVLGRVGDASRLKMALGGLSKGLSMLLLEQSLLACSAGMLEVMLEEVRRFYPELHALGDRLLPTFGRHAARRVEELAEIENTGAGSPLVREIRHMIEELAALGSGELEGCTNMKEFVEKVREARSRAGGGR